MWVWSYRKLREYPGEGYLIQKRRFEKVHWSVDKDLVWDIAELLATRKVPDLATKSRSLCVEILSRMSIRVLLVRMCEDITIYIYPPRREREDPSNENSSRLFNNWRLFELPVPLSLARGAIYILHAKIQFMARANHRANLIPRSHTRLFIPRSIVFGFVYFFLLTVYYIHLEVFSHIPDLRSEIPDPESHVSHVSHLARVRIHARLP